MGAIKKFYNITFPRIFTNEIRIHKYINILIYGEHLVIEKLCNNYVRKLYPKCLKQLNTNERDRKIIISFTTIPSRINTIPIMLKSVFNQTMMPDRIILWITDKIENKDIVEELLSEEIEHGLEIRYIKDIQVHTKYYYALEENPDDIVITLDDDILYPEDLIEKLYKSYLENPGCIIAARTHEITFNNNDLKKYKDWNKLAPGKQNKDKSLLATGVGGVLYPPQVLYKDWKNIDLFLKLSAKADDIWLKIMETLAGTDVVKLYRYTKENFIIGSTQSIALSKQNVGEDRNDVFMSNCLNHYGLNAKNFQ